MINKYLKISLFSMLLSSFAFGQNFDGPKKGSAIGFSANLVDFSASLPKIGKVDPGFSVMYWKGITNKLDFSVRYNGLFSDYTQNAGIESSGDYINEFEGALHLRALNDDHLLNPFLTAGIGIGSYGKKAWAPYSPLGIGLQMNMYGEGYLFLQANYRVSFTDTKLDNNMFYSLGFTLPLTHSKPKVEPVPVQVVVPVTDRDHDGVPDSTDACPDVAGLASLQGCPDKDGDGIADKDDKCPDVAGIAKYNGCPIPDTDGDGINDEEDKCPTVAGVAKYNGCPIPDTDGDGVNDEEDRCPNLAGTVANHGCPEVKEEVRKRIDIAAKNIYFVSGSSKLLAKSNKSLDEVARILESDQNLKLDINGHTDNTGKAESNQALSEKRAQAVYDYLVKKGVDQSRIKSEGFGQDQPIADNKTAAGRAKNRRVELKLHYD
jgi:outer membrane protein OmpA-like peptidoglycan-associated protein